MLIPWLIKGENKFMNKIFVVDLDGTILQENSISEGNLNAAKKIISSGVDIIIATGRHPSMTTGLLNQLEIKLPLIGCNGGIIKDFTNNETLFCETIQKDKVEKILQIAKKNNIDFWVYDMDYILYMNSSRRLDSYMKINNTLDEEKKIKIKHVSSIKEIMDDKYKIIKVLLLLEDKIEKKQKLYDELKGIEELEVCQSSEMLVDVMNKGVSKGKALKYYIENIRKTPCKTFAIGDNYNDISMIEYADFGIVMGQAEDYVKSKGDFVTLTYEEDGFAHAVEYIMKIQKLKMQNDEA